MSHKPWLALVGGFLGAGKTTLITAAARELTRRGVKCAAIMNDQGAGLVDTRIAGAEGILADEVTGGCFCCRLSDLIDAARELARHSPGVIFAEPVGSCTDISATTIRPLLRDHADEFRLAPFTVLVDPSRAAAIQNAPGDDDFAFLFRKQIEEADIVCMTKSDLFPHRSIAISDARRISAKTGDGVAAWLDEIVSGELRAGRTVLDMDYERYAAAEAALVWLNLELTLAASDPVSPAMAIGPMLDRIAAGLRSANIEIAHLKIADDADSGFLKAAICETSAAPSVDGALDASPAVKHRIRLNLRARGNPDPVRAIVSTAASALPGTAEIIRFECFRPAPPKPERRLTV